MAHAHSSERIVFELRGRPERKRPEGFKGRLPLEMLRDGMMKNGFRECKTSFKLSVSKLYTHNCHRLESNPNVETKAVGVLLCRVVIVRRYKQSFKLQRDTFKL